VTSAATPRPPALQLVAAFGAIYVIWGSTYLAIRIAIESIPPFLMAGVRFLIAGALLLAWARARRLPRPGGPEWRAGFLIGGLLLLGGNGGVSWAELRVPSGPAALIVALVPLWVVLLQAGGIGGVRRRPQPSMLIGLALGITGFLLLVGPDRLVGRGRLDPIGAGALVLATLSWSIGTVRSRTAGLPSSTVVATAIQMIGGGTLLLLAATLTGELSHVRPAAVTMRSILALAYLIFLGGIVAYSAYVWLLRVAPATQVATYAWVNPIVAVLLGWALGGEPLTLRTVLASIVIVAGVVVVNTAGHGRAPMRVKGETERELSVAPGSIRSAGGTPGDGA
jgi:drug/metabolite transporter (DMT)-like permease